MASVTMSRESTAYQRALIERLEQVETEQATLTEQIEGLVGRRDELQIEIGHLRALLGLTERSSTRPPARADTSVADLVVQLLTEAGRPLHYRDIAESLQSKYGVPANGKDPANVFLARYFNDPRLYRPARGTYALRTREAVRNVGTRAKKKHSTRARSRGRAT